MRRALRGGIILEKVKPAGEPGKAGERGEDVYGSSRGSEEVSGQSGRDQRLRIEQDANRYYQ